MIASPLMMFGKGIPKEAPHDQTNFGKANSYSVDHLSHDEADSSSRRESRSENSIAEVAEEMPEVTPLDLEALEQIKNDIRSFIQTLNETATDDQKVEAVRNFLKNRHPDINSNLYETIECFF